MRLTGVMLLLFAVAGHHLCRKDGQGFAAVCALLGAARLLVGSFALIERTSTSLLAAILIAVVTPGTSLLALSCAVDRFALRESVRELIQLADARGYGSAPVFMLSRIERTSEFYASGRVAYGSDGEPIRLGSGDEVVRQVQQTQGPFLIIAPLGSIWQLNNLQGVQTNVIGDNGRVAVVAVSAW